MPPHKDDRLVLGPPVRVDSIKPASLELMPTLGAHISTCSGSDSNCSLALRVNVVSEISCARNQSIVAVDDGEPGDLGRPRQTHVAHRNNRHCTDPVKETIVMLLKLPSVFRLMSWKLDEYDRSPRAPHRLQLDSSSGGKVLSIVTVPFSSVPRFLSWEGFAEGRTLRQVCDTLSGLHQPGEKSNVASFIF
jgi:hypothetical protein